MSLRDIPETNPNPDTSSLYGASEHDTTTTSLGLPDLQDILAALNTRRETTPETTTVQDTEDILAFGENLRQFSCIYQDVAASTKATDAKVTRPVRQKGNKVPKVNKPRAKKSELAIDRKAKTITERSIYAYLPQVSPAKVAVQDITQYITPSKSTCSRTLSKRKVSNKANPENVLSSNIVISPRKASGRYMSQKLIYNNISQDLREPLALSMSKLITLSRGLWHAGNRDSNGQTTDGGQVFEAHQGTFMDVSCAIDDDLGIPTLYKEDTYTYVGDSADGDREPRATQEYLRDLVAGSDHEHSLHEFPMERNIIDLATDESFESLRTHMEPLNRCRSPHHQEPASSAHAISKRHRQHFSAPDPRSVSPKIVHDSSPTARPILILSESSDGESDVPLRSLLSTRSQLPTETSSMPVPLRSGPSGLRTRDVTTVSAINVVQEGGNDFIPTVIDAQEESRPMPLTNQTTSNGQDGPQRIWVVPDSEGEDEFLEILEPVQLTEEPLAPDLSRLSTGQLQTELSKFGFKASKNRAGMVNLLDKCWRSKGLQQSTHSRLISTASAANIHAHTRLHESTTVSNAPQVSPIKQARETAAQKKQRLQSERELKQAQKLVLKQEKAAQKALDNERKKQDKLAAKQSLLDSKRTTEQETWRAITHLLRTSTSGRGSDLGSALDASYWWFKILNYEPIVLEDFVAFLASPSGGSMVVDVDSARDYFDSTGVCCVRKVTRAGKARKRL